MTERTNTTPTADGRPFVRPAIAQPNSEQRTANGEQANTEAEQLRERLSAERAVTGVRHEHQLGTRTQRAEHQISLDDLSEHVANAKRSRRERYRDARDAVALADLYRRAGESGTRAYIRAQIQRSAEMRALRIDSIRRTSLVVGLPVLLAFAAWSTSGVQGGVTRLLRITTGSFAWAASWGVEPALITIVAMIIIGRALLNSSGGKTDWRAGLIEGGALFLSLALNIIGGWPTGAHWEGFATALPHAIGPIGCAVTAYLIGLFDLYTSDATPWVGAPRLKDLDLVIAQVGERPNVLSSTVRELANAEQANVLPANEHPAIEHPFANVLPANTEQANAHPEIERTNVHQANTEQANTEQANARPEIERTNVHQAIEQQANTVQPSLDDIVRPARRTANSEQGVDPQLIERLDQQFPDWRTNIPSARTLASALGYTSSSTGNRIRRSLIVLTEPDD